MKSSKRSKKLFDYLEENVEIDPEALPIDLERDYVDAYSQGMSAREQLIEKHSKGAIIFFSGVLKILAGPGCPKAANFDFKSFRISAQFR